LERAVSLLLLFKEDQLRQAPKKDFAIAASLREIAELIAETL
jgi:hypothetical protein